MTQHLYRFENTKKNKKQTKKEKYFSNKLVKFLKEQGFKRKWFLDFSGYWFSKKINNSIFGKGKIAVEEKYILIDFKGENQTLDLKTSPKIKLIKKAIKMFHSNK